MSFAKQGKSIALVCDKADPQPQKTSSFLTCDPVVFGAVLLTLVNDHFFKYSEFSGMVTGKISDFSGVFYFPFLLFDLSMLVGVRKSSLIIQSYFFVCFQGLTGFLMVIINTNETLCRAYEDLMSLLGIYSKVTMDSTDLIALGIIPLGTLYYNHLRRKENDV